MKAAAFLLLVLAAQEVFEAHSAPSGMSGFFVKGPKSVPRVGRSYDGGPEDASAKYMRSFVILTPKNIPRMGRRNFDSEGVYDIPKLDSYNEDTVLQSLYNQAKVYDGELEDMPAK